MYHKLSLLSIVLIVLALALASWPAVWADDDPPDEDRRCTPTPTRTPEDDDDDDEGRDDGAMGRCTPTATPEPVVTAIGLPPTLPGTPTPITVATPTNTPTPTELPPTNTPTPLATTAVIVVPGATPQAPSLYYVYVPLAAMDCWDMLGGDNCAHVMTSRSDER